MNTREQLDKTDIFLIIIVIVYNLTMSFIGLLWLFTQVFDPLKGQLFGQDNTQINYILSYFFFSGIIGGLLYTGRALYQRLGAAFTPLKGKDSVSFNIKVWLYWYIYRPLQGGILALITVSLFNSGFINLNSSESIDVSSLYFQVGLGALVGFGTHEVLNKLEEVIKVIFAKSSKPDKNSNPDQGSSEKVAENSETQQ